MIKPTGISFVKGEALKSSYLNTMNSTINELVSVVNAMLLDRVNINIEIIGATGEELTLQEAIARVPTDRRADGVVIKFNEKDHGWTEYIYGGGGWGRLGAWSKVGSGADDESGDEIDGGEVNV